MTIWINSSGGLVVSSEYSFDVGIVDDGGSKLKQHWDNVSRMMGQLFRHRHDWHLWQGVLWCSLKIGMKRVNPLPENCCF